MTPLEPHSARPRIQSDSRCVRDDQVLVLAHRHQPTMLTGVLAPPHPLGRPLFEVVSPQTLYCAWSPAAALEGTRVCVCAASRAKRRQSEIVLVLTSIIQYSSSTCMYVSCIFYVLYCTVLVTCLTTGYHSGLPQ